MIYYLISVYFSKSKITVALQSQGNIYLRSKACCTAFSYARDKSLFICFFSEKYQFSLLLFFLSIPQFNCSTQNNNRLFLRAHLSINEVLRFYITLKLMSCSVLETNSLCFIITYSKTVGYEIHQTKIKSFNDKIPREIVEKTICDNLHLYLQSAIQIIHANMLKVLLVIEGGGTILLKGMKFVCRSANLACLIYPFTLKELCIIATVQL